MRSPLIACLALTLALGGCGSRLNPFNWFHRAERVERVQDTPETAADKRQLIQQVTHVTFDPYPGGVIVRATGLPPTQGWWEAELVPRKVDEEGVLVYDFRVFAPMTQQSVNTPRSREITAAASLSDYKLAGIKRVVVQGEANALGSSR
ncbi:MAG: hypothetical protein QM656_09880 [Paracoccaceae bacterium]